MVEEQIAARGVTDRLVLAAMRCVPRDRFLDPDQASAAYADQALPIGDGQTISQPYMVALMCSELELTGGERVLEVGTGSGYQAAILAEIAERVTTVERIPALAERARATLAALGYTNVSVKLAEDTLGWPDEAPFDAIVVAAGARTVPDDLVRQLADGGRIVVPVGDRRSQTLIRGVARHGRLERTRLCGCSFVPLIGHGGWDVPKP